MSKPTPAQHAVIRYFNGDRDAPTSKNHATLDRTYAICKANGWIKQIDEFPFHQTTEAGAEAAEIVWTWRPVNPGRRIDPTTRVACKFHGQSAPATLLPGERQYGCYHCNSDAPVEMSYWEKRSAELRKVRERDDCASRL